MRGRLSPMKSAALIALSAFILFSASCASLNLSENRKVDITNLSRAAAVTALSTRDAGEAQILAGTLTVLADALDELASGKTNPKEVNAMIVAFTGNEGPELAVISAILASYVDRFTAGEHGRTAAEVAQLVSTGIRDAASFYLP